MNTRGGKKKKPFSPMLSSLLACSVLAEPNAMPISKHTCMNHAEFAGGGNQQ
jgi:hypothetical protein